MSLLKCMRLAESRPKSTLVVGCFVLLLAFAGPSEAQKRPLTAKDFDSWKDINGQALSRDGHCLAYRVSQRKATAK